MNRCVVPLSIPVAFLLAIPVTLIAADVSTTVTAGLDSSLDGAVGLAGTGHGEGSLYGHALGYISWQPV